MLEEGEVDDDPGQDMTGLFTSLWPGSTDNPPLATERVRPWGVQAKTAHHRQLPGAGPVISMRFPDWSPYGRPLGDHESVDRLVVNMRRHEFTDLTTAKARFAWLGDECDRQVGDRGVEPREDADLGEMAENLEKGGDTASRWSVYRPPPRSSPRGQLAMRSSSTAARHARVGSTGVMLGEPPRHHESPPTDR